MDTAVCIVSVFLFFSLVHGLLCAKSTNTFKEYSVGNKNFTTSTMVATLIATEYSGLFLLREIEYTYKEGVYFIFIILIANIIWPWMNSRLTLRMQEFLNHYSIAESMGALFGNKVRVITAVAGICMCIGSITIQLHIIIISLQSLLPGEYSNLYCYIAIGIVLLYTVRGGIRAVTLTDVVQFITATISILIWIFLIIKNIGSFESITNLFKTNINFNLSRIDLSKARDAIILAWIFSIPVMSPPIIQKLYIAAHIEQIKNTFKYSIPICIIITIFPILLGILLLVDDPNLDPTKYIDYIINRYTLSWLKGLSCITLLSLTISSADSFLHSASVLYTHDIVSVVKKNITDNSKIWFSRTSIVLIGILSLLMTFYIENICTFFLFRHKLYFTTVTIPFITAIFGFRPQSISVLWGMGAGFVTTIIFYFLEIKISSRIMPYIVPICMHLLFLMGSHYILPKIPNTGWIGIKKKEPLLLEKQMLRRILRSWIYAAQNNIFWSAAIIYRIYGFYILVTHLVASFFVKKYWSLGYYMLAIVWGMFFCIKSDSMEYRIKYYKDKAYTTTWILGLICFLFITGPLNFIIHGYQWIHGILLYINLIVASFLWPLYLVIIATFFCIMVTLVFYTPYDATPSFWLTWIKKNSATSLWIIVLTSMLMFYIHFLKGIQKIKLREKYSKNKEN